MKNILLLGGFGFIGTNLMKYIDSNCLEDYSVVVFDKLPTHPYGITFVCLEKVYDGDFSDTVYLKSIFQNYKFDLVIHSLSTTVPITSNNVRFDIESNLIPTIELLNLLVEFSIKDIIFISSGGAIYGASEDIIKHKETDNTNPLSSYGIVKLAIEKYLFQYASLYGLRPLVIRLSNPYGRFHYSTKQGICNVALRAAIQNETFNVWGTGEARKDYIFIDDFCDILFKLYKKSIHNKVLNIGSGCVLSLNQILNEIKTLVPSFCWSYTESSKFDISHFELNTVELHKIIGNYNYSTFESGLAIVCDWLHNNISNPYVCEKVVL